MAAARDDSFPWPLCLLIVLAIAGSRSRDTDVPPGPEPQIPEISTGLFSDIRLQIEPKAHAMAVEFIKTGRISRGRIGVDMTQVKGVRCEPGRLIFEPPIRLTYDGPGPLNAGTIVKEMRIKADDTIVIDVVNSPIDLILDTKE